MKQWSDMKMSDKLLSLKVARQSNPKMTYWQLRDLLSDNKYDEGKDSFDFLDNSIENVLGLLNLQLSTPDNIIDTTPSKITTPVTLTVQLYKIPIEKLLYDENNQPYPIVANSKFLLKYKNIDTHLVDLVDDTLSNAGLNDVQRAAIMGHIMLESKFNPNTYNSAKTRTGFILNDKTRMLLIQLYAKIINHTKEDYPGLNEVLKMIYDIKNASTNKKSSINQWYGDDKLFMNTSDPSKLNDLVNEFGLRYIRNGKDGTLNKRIKYALDALDYIKSRLR